MTEAIVTDLNGSGIYQIRNTVNGNRYIGSSIRFQMRWRKHVKDLIDGKHHSAYLQRSWNKYGANAFAFEVIELCQVSSLIEREQFWIDDTSPEYNVSPTAANCTGVKHAAGSYLERSVKARLRKDSPETVARKAAWIRTPELGRKISATHKLRGIGPSPACIAASVALRLGKKQSPEFIAKRAAGMMGHEVSVETRAKISASNKLYAIKYRKRNLSAIG